MALEGVKMETFHLQEGDQEDEGLGEELFSPRKPQAIRQDKHHRRYHSHQPHSISDNHRHSHKSKSKSKLRQVDDCANDSSDNEDGNNDDSDHGDNDDYDEKDEKKRKEKKKKSKRKSKKSKTKSVIAPVPATSAKCASDHDESDPNNDDSVKVRKRARKMPTVKCAKHKSEAFTTAQNVSFDPSNYFMPTPAMRPTDPSLYPTKVVCPTFSVSHDSLSGGGGGGGGGGNNNVPSPYTGDSESGDPDNMSISSDTSSAAIIAGVRSPGHKKSKPSAISPITSLDPTPTLDDEADEFLQKKQSISPRDGDEEEESHIVEEDHDSNHDNEESGDDKGNEGDDEDDRPFGRTPVMPDLSTPTPAPIYYGDHKGDDFGRKRPVSSSCDSSVVGATMDDGENKGKRKGKRNNDIDNSNSNSENNEPKRGDGDGEYDSERERTEKSEKKKKNEEKKKKKKQKKKKGVLGTMKNGAKRVLKGLRLQFKAIIILILLIGTVIPVAVAVVLSIQRVRKMLGDYMPAFYAISSADYKSLIQGSLETAEYIADVEVYAYGDDMYSDSSSRESAESSIFGYGLSALSYVELHSTIYLYAAVGSVYYGMSDMVNGSLVYRLSYYSTYTGLTYHYVLDEIVTSIRDLTPVRVANGLDIAGPAMEAPPEVSTWASFVHSEYPQYMFFKSAYKKTGKYIGMITSSYMLETLRDVMASIPISGDLTFIVDTHDDMVLASTLDGLASERPTPLARAQSEVALDAAAKIKARFGSWDALGNTSTAFWTSDAKNEIISVGMLVKPGLKWAVITVYRDTIRPLDPPAAAVIAIVVCIAVALSIICSFEIVNPIKVLSWKMRKISKLNFQALSGDGEVEIISTVNRSRDENEGEGERIERQRQRKLRRLRKRQKQKQRQRQRRGGKSRRELRQRELYDYDDIEYEDEGNTYSSKDSYAVGNVYYYHSSSSSSSTSSDESSSSDNASSSSAAASENENASGYDDGISTSSVDTTNMSATTGSSNNNSDSSSSSDSDSSSSSSDSENGNTPKLPEQGAPINSGDGSGQFNLSVSTTPETSGIGGVGNVGAVVGRTNGNRQEGGGGSKKEVERCAYLSEGFKNSERYSSINELREMQESFEKLRRVTQALTRYIPKQVVLHEILGSDGKELQIEMVPTKLAILFVDVQDFTKLSEDLAPAKLILFLNTWLREFCRVIEAHRGTVDKFIGDCIMALFCAPVARPDGEALACAAALGFRSAGVRVNRLLRHKKMPPVQYRVGIHTGSVLLGNIGYAGHINYTVCGPNVSIGEAMERLGKKYRLTPLISGEVARRVWPRFVCVMVGVVAVSKTRLVRVHYLAGKRSTCPKCDELAEDRFAKIFEQVAAESYEYAVSLIHGMYEDRQFSHYRMALRILDKEVKSGVLNAGKFKMSEPHSDSDETSTTTAASMTECSQSVQSSNEKG